MAERVGVVFHFVSVGPSRSSLTLRSQFAQAGKNGRPLAGTRQPVFRAVPTDTTVHR
jgi:hypothetical protein